MRKILSILLVVFSIGLILPSCGESKAEKEARIAQQQQEMQQREDERKKNSVFGTWELIDANNKKWEIIVNEDRTIRVSDGNTVYYGSLGYPCIQVEAPIVFPNGWLLLGQGVLDRDEKYLYATRSFGDAKNPNARLSVKKTKW